jgi:hypothetical protein
MLTRGLLRHKLHKERQANLRFRLACNEVVDFDALDHYSPSWLAEITLPSQLQIR